MPSLQRTLIRALDRPGGRTFLAALASRRARRLTQQNVSVLYDRGWLHRVNGVFIPDGPNFEYYANTVIAWSHRLDRLRASIRDYWFHLYTPQAGDIVLDIGAGIGLDTLVFSDAVGPGGRVYAVESHPRTFGLLQAACRHNQLANVRACHCAITDRRGIVFAEDVAEHESARVAASAGTGWRSEPILALSLDDFCRQHAIRRIDLLKMNIEGAERQAILGMSETLKITRHLCIACHDHRSEDGAELCTRQTVSAFLEQAGFEIHLRDDDPREFVRDHVHAKNRSLVGRDRSEPRAQSSEALSPT